MTNIRTYILSIATLALFAACSSNQDLVQLEEYDDLYYTPAPREYVSQPYSANEFLGANSAESSYYGESPYVEEAEKPSEEFAGKANSEEDSVDVEDYFDPDYAARIENFENDENPDYVYSDAYTNNMNPRFSGSMSMNSFNGFNSFGLGMSMGMGNPWMGNRWCDPFFDPFCNCNPWGRPGFGMNMGMGWGSPYGMYSPYSPWYNPYAWGNPYGYNPYYGGGVIVVDGGGNSRGYQNTRRSNGSRNSRGGAVGNTSDRRGVVTQNGEGPKSNQVATTRKRNTSSQDVNGRTRPVRSATDADYYSRTDSRQYSRGNDLNSSNRNRLDNGNSRSASQRQNAVTSPYTRERQRQTSTSSTTDYSRYNRSNSNRSYNSTRSRTGNTFSSPTRTTRTSPSTTSPNRSRSTFSSPGTSSPSRSTGGGGGSRRR